MDSYCDSSLFSEKFEDAGQRFNIIHFTYRSVHSKQDVLDIFLELVTLPFDTLFLRKHGWPRISRQLFFAVTRVEVLLETTKEEEVFQHMYAIVCLPVLMNFLLRTLAFNVLRSVSKISTLLSYTDPSQGANLNL